MNPTSQVFSAIWQLKNDLMALPVSFLVPEVRFLNVVGLDFGLDLQNWGSILALKTHKVGSILVSISSLDLGFGARFAELGWILL